MLHVEPLNRHLLINDIMADASWLANIFYTSANGDIVSANLHREVPTIDEWEAAPIFTYDIPEASLSSIPGEYT